MLQTKNMNFRGEYYRFGALSRYSPECSKLEMLKPMFSDEGEIITNSGPSSSVKVVLA